MLRYPILFVIIYLFISPEIKAQEDKSLEELGNEAFVRQEYAVAAGLYGKVEQRKGRKTPIVVLEKLAHCYVEMARFEDAGYYYLRLLGRPEKPSYANLYYGEMQMSIGAYDTARKYIALYQTTNADSLQWKQLLLSGCDSAVKWKSAGSTVAIESIKELNSEGADWISGVVKKGLLLVSNGYRKMSLSTGSERNPLIDLRVNEPYFKPYIYRQYEKGSNANTYLEEVLPDLLKKLPYHIGPVCFNRREDTAYITLSEANKDVFNKTRKGPLNGERLMSLFMSVRKGDTWSPLLPLTTLNFPGSYTGNAVLSEDGQTLYFVSDRPGGVGKTDIWYSEQQANGAWGQAKNCGREINTRWEESFPTINEDGALYFSSKGHPGIGGFDIFRASGSRGEWTPPLNLRNPYNSGGDDLGFIMKDNHYEGYLSSNREGGTGGDDVYHFLDNHFTENLKNLQPVAPVLTPPPAPEAQDSIAKTINPPKAVDTGLIHKLEQLCFYYDYNSGILLTSSKELLDRVATVLKQHKDWKLMIYSYADSRGSFEYNNNLTALRCYAVIDYLIKQGIPPSHLYYENLGERGLVNDCGDGVPCSEAEHQKNRRSTLRVIY
ncbi:OmpA family protein [Chitinophaga tropicalis]|uniref:OmpA family protein n=1 Tax=Chitinophaga tropicalis TaxID=2683588 RepID=A0A7K1U246_9BACT|nr:OmpA family protein [Chitinophaga tropicalis]MVT08346.1 OmpA family protein [Chitinophaga tropicalis]